MVSSIEIISLNCYLVNKRVMLIPKIACSGLVGTAILLSKGFWKFLEWVWTCSSCEDSMVHITTHWKIFNKCKIQMENSGVFVKGPHGCCWWSQLHHNLVKLLFLFNLLAKKLFEFKNKISSMFFTISAFMLVARQWLMRISIVGSMWKPEGRNRKKSIFLSNTNESSNRDYCKIKHIYK